MQLPSDHPPSLARNWSSLLMPCAKVGDHQLISAAPACSILAAPCRSEPEPASAHRPSSTAPHRFHRPRHRQPAVSRPIPRRSGRPCSPALDPPLPHPLRGRAPDRGGSRAIARNIVLLLLAERRSTEVGLPEITVDGAEVWVGLVGTHSSVGLPVPEHAVVGL